MDKVNTVIGWAGWAGCVLGVVGLIGVGIYMFTSHREGRTGDQEAGRRLGFVITGLILITAASAIVGAITGVDPTT